MADQGAAPAASEPRPNLVETSARLFSAVFLCVSKEETRYYLNGVYVHPHPEKGIMLVATDGHRLLVAHDEAGICTKPSIVAIDKEGAKALARSDKERLVVSAEGVVSIPGLFLAAKSSIIDGIYPDYVRLLKPMLADIKASKRSAASFNGEYLSAFAKIAGRLSNPTTPSMRVVAFDEASPALVLFPSALAANVFGILMPMRADVGNAFPAFMKPILEPTPKPAPVEKKAAAPRPKPQPRKAPAKKAAKKLPPKKKPVTKRRRAA